MTRDEWIELLSAQGFEDPAAWVDFARRHDFERVPAARLAACPHCGSTERGLVGPYVYHSHYARLWTCRRCGLWYSDLRLDPAAVASHFEDAYKDEEYFRTEREPILREMARLVAKRMGPGARVLDVGGAKGHLLAHLGGLRPDLRLTLSDLSRRACDHAREHYGLEAIHGGIADLAAGGRRFDAVVLGDVIYYEPDLDAVWRLLERTLEPGGLAVIRVPNKVAWIRFAARIRRSEAAIAGFNPEQLYVFTPGFLTTQLKRRGFTRLEVRASRMLGAGPVGEVVYQLLRRLGTLLPGPPLTPAMVITGIRS